MHLVIGDQIRFHRLKGANPNVEGNEFVWKLLEQFLGKMQTCSRRGHGSGGRGKNSLVSFGISSVGFTLDVRWQRHFAALARDRAGHLAALLLHHPLLVHHAFDCAVNLHVPASRDVGNPRRGRSRRRVDRILRGDIRGLVLFDQMALIQRQAHGRADIIARGGDLCLPRSHHPRLRKHDGIFHRGLVGQHVGCASPALHDV